jgi:uncharacterized damage-inducible protein DinB
MTATSRLSNHLRRTVDGPMWHGPSLSESLGGVTAEMAAKHTVRGAHSIWELVLHIAAWAEIARLRLRGPTPHEETTAVDWPPVTDTSAAAWGAAVAALGKSYYALGDDVRSLGDERLIERVPGRDHSVYDMIHGVIEHGTYHGGQIAILIRALEGGR